MDFTKRFGELKEASGTITYSDPLTTFLYLLMRNDLPAGKVEMLVREAVDGPEECEFTNGWLAKYANNLAEEIKNARVSHLSGALEKAFAIADNERKERVKKEGEVEEKIMKEGVSDTITEEEFSALEEKIKEASAKGELNPDKDSGEDESAAIDVAKDAVRQLVKSGHMSEEDAAAINKDIDEVKKEIELSEVASEDTDDADKFTGPTGTGELTAKEQLALAEGGFSIPNVTRAEKKEFVKWLKEQIPEETKPDPEIENMVSEEAKELVETAVKTSKQFFDGLKVETLVGGKWKETKEELKKIDEEEKEEE